MPEITRFYGIIIKLFFGDHPPPYFHAVYGEYNAIFYIETLEMIEGDLPSRARKLVVEWATSYQSDLQAMWKYKNSGNCHRFNSHGYSKSRNAIPEEGHFLIVLFSNGKKKRYDINRLAKHEMFLPLKNPAFFKNVSVEPGGYAVSWNSEIDISEYELWQHGEKMP